MPIYTVENDETGKVKDVMMSSEKFEKWLKRNKKWHQVFSKPPAYCEQHRINSNKKMTSDFKDRLAEVKRSHPKGHFPEV